jgi:tetratricopeptide (TPR) repeat protein
MAPRPLALALLLVAAIAGAAPPSMESSLERIRHEWAVAAFELEPGRRAATLEILGEMAHRLARRHPGEVEPQLWKGIVLASLAESRGPISGYFTARKARNILRKVEAREPAALEGPGYAALGLLHASALPWPLSFGDREAARAYFEKAVATAPGGMEAHYFYGGFLLRQGEREEAARHLRRALLGRLRSDPGDETGVHQRREIRRALARAERGS